MAMNRKGRIAFLPFCKLTLKGAKSTPYPKELRTVGDHLRKRRLDLGLSQKDVALQLEVDKGKIWRWENNKTSPAMRDLSRIIVFLGYDPYPEP